MLKYADLKDEPSQILAVTSLTHEEFERVLPKFIEAHNEVYPLNTRWDGQPRQRRSGGGMKGALAQIEDKLLFILMYHKVYSIQAAHGLQFGLSQSQANYWIHRLLPVLRLALAKLEMTPVRDGSQLAHSLQQRDEPADLQMDGTDRRRQRPKDGDQQRATYTGKHKAHPDKNVVLISEHTQHVAYLSPTQPGSVHDKKVADAAALTFPPDTTLVKDTGFQGYEPAGVITIQPKKAKRQAAQRG
jgi:DDE superfamily endonuclease